MQETIPTSLSPANIGKIIYLSFSHFFLSVNFPIALTRIILINPILHTWFKDSWFTYMWWFLNQKGFILNFQIGIDNLTILSIFQMVKVMMQYNPTK